VISEQEKGRGILRKRSVAVSEPTPSASRGEKVQEEAGQGNPSLLY